MRIPDHEYKQIVEETDKAIEKGYDAAHAQWRIRVLEILHEVCTRMDKFTVNDFRPEVEEAGVSTHDNRAMGGIMRTAVKLKWIEKTGDSIPSLVGHKVPLQIWRSLIVGRVTVHPNQQRLI